MFVYPAWLLTMKYICIFFYFLNKIFNRKSGNGFQVISKVTGEAPSGQRDRYKQVFFYVFLMLQRLSYNVILNTVPEAGS